MPSGPEVEPASGAFETAFAAAEQQANDAIKALDDLEAMVVKELEASGVFDYSIYLDESTLTLFAFQKLKDHNSSASLASREIVKKWWKHMADIMETNLKTVSPGQDEMVVQVGLKGGLPLLNSGRRF